MRRGTKQALADLYAADAKKDEPKQAQTPKEANAREKEKAENHSAPFMKALELKRQNALLGDDAWKEYLDQERVAEEEFLQHMCEDPDETLAAEMEEAGL